MVPIAEMKESNGILAPKGQWILWLSPQRHGSLIERMGRVNTYIDMYVCMYIYVHTYMYVRTYVMYIHMYVRLTDRLTG